MVSLFDISLDTSFYTLLDTIAVAKLLKVHRLLSCHFHYPSGCYFYILTIGSWFQLVV